MELVFKGRAEVLLPRDAPHRFHRIRWEIRVEMYPPPHVTMYPPPHRIQWEIRIEMLKFE